MIDNSHISTQNLNVYYGNNHVLKNINIDIPEKKITAIIGPSGCGKTTLLRCFNRLIDTNEDVKINGKVLVDGDNIYSTDIDVPNIRKKMGLLSQRPFPLPMSIYNNVAFGPKIHGLKNKSKLNELVERYLKEASLWEEVKDRLHAPAVSLSIGQQQRLCLARGLAVEPEIILGDEPTSALDPQSSTNIEQLFINLKSRYTIVIVTHILRQARRLADNIIFMHSGEVIEVGNTKTFFENPQHQLTKDYISGVFS